MDELRAGGSGGERVVSGSAPLLFYRSIHHMSRAYGSRFEGVVSSGVVALNGSVGLRLGWLGSLKIRLRRCHRYQWLWFRFVVEVVVDTQLSFFGEGLLFLLFDEGRTEELVSGFGVLEHASTFRDAMGVDFVLLKLCETSTFSRSLICALTASSCALSSCWSCCDTRV